MEFVLALLTVTLLVVLPVLYLLLTLGGLFYTIGMVIRGEKKEGARSSGRGSSPAATREGQPPREGAGLVNGNASKVLK